MTPGPGQRLGPYTIVSQLGAGEMGVVYQAHDSRLERDVAVKVLPARIAADEDMVARFEREVRAIAALSHPNVLAIYDVGQTDGLIYAVMELVRGATLRERIAGGPLPHTLVVDFTAQIARGLAAAHAKGIVHRDLKPENVFVTDEGLLKILDFGLAKFDPLGLGRGDHATMFSTVPGVVLGTLAYMAPEQLRGAAVDHRADLFSLGAMLFEMLNGEPPFARASPAETIAALMSTDGPDTAALAAMPAALAALAAGCLAKPVGERPESAEAVLAHLDTGTRVTAIGLTRAPATAPAAPATVAATPAGAPRSIAVLPFADMSPARDQDYFCEGMADEIISVLARVRGLRVVARSSAFRFKNHQADVREVAKALGVEAVLEGSVRTAGSRIRVTAQLVSATDGYQLWTERFDRDVADVFAVQDEIAGAVRHLLTASLADQHRTIVPPTRPASLDAYTLYLKGRHLWSRRTRHGLEQSLECFRQALATDEDYAQASAGLADSYLMLGLYGLEAPDRVMPLAADAARRALDQQPNLAGAHASLACVDALYGWKWEEAGAEFERALGIDPNLATAYQWRAMNLLLPFGRFDEAAADLARAVELDPISPAIAASLGLHAHFAGESAAGLVALDRALAQDPTASVVHFFRSQILADRGEGTAALEAVGHAVAHGGPSPELTAAEGHAYAASGDRGRAEGIIATLSTMATEGYVSPVGRAQIHAGLGDEDGALDALEQAADLRAADLVWLAVRPVFAPLAGLPRFNALQARMGLRPVG